MPTFEKYRSNKNKKLFVYLKDFFIVCVYIYIVYTYINFKIKFLA